VLRLDLTSELLCFLVSEATVGMEMVTVRVSEAALLSSWLITLCLLEGLRVGPCQVFEHLAGRLGSEHVGTPAGRRG